jgi:hypothetical protein
MPVRVEPLSCVLEGAASSLVSKSFVRAFGLGGIIGFYSSSTSAQAGECRK